MCIFCIAWKEKEKPSLTTQKQFFLDSSVPTKAHRCGWLLVSNNDSIWLLKQNLWGLLMNSLFQVLLKKCQKKGSGFWERGLRDVASHRPDAGPQTLQAQKCSVCHGFLPTILTGLHPCPFPRLLTFLGKIWMSSSLEDKPIVLPCGPRSQLNHNSCSMYPKDFRRMYLCSLLSFPCPWSS